MTPGKLPQAKPTRPARLADPRLWQIGVLTMLLAYGSLVLDLEIDLAVAIAVLGGVLLVQAIGSRCLGLRFDWRSPLISGLSLCLLLRTSSLVLALLAAAVAIGSKFLIRRRGKHVFNPSALGLVASILLSDRAWVSAGQWGSVALFGVLIAGLGMVVVHRAERSDVSVAFLLSWAAVIFGRAAWLGDPVAIPLHQLQSGALLLFAFFMISDPKTTPDSRAGRILFAMLVALGAGAVQFGLYRANGPLYALLACSLVVPWIDRLLPADRYTWRSGSTMRWRPVWRSGPSRAVGAVGSSAAPKCRYPSLVPDPIRSSERRS